LIQINKKQRIKGQLKCTIGERLRCLLS
jgi:hypothetical protein